MSCSCGTNPCQCGSSPCAPANTVFLAACRDPGLASYGNHVSIRDSQFCDRRLENTPGFLVCQPFGGTFRSFFTTAPTVPLDQTQTVAGTPFGNIVIIGGDGAWSQLTGPVTPNLYLRTNAAGQLIFGVLPSTTIPDPLTVGQLNTTILNVGGTATFGGLAVFNSLATDAIAFNIGLNASNQLVIGTAATTGVQTAMFFESPTSPGGSSPNENANVGDLLVIGNLINESVTPAVPGGALITPINSQTLQVVQGGWYNFDFCALITGTTGVSYITLQINGVAVNYGNASNLAVQATTQRIQNLTGFASGRFPAGTTITLQLGAAPGSPKTYGVRLRATRTGA